MSLFLWGLMNTITTIICDAVTVCGRAGGNDSGDVAAQTVLVLTPMTSSLPTKMGMQEIPFGAFL